MTNKEAARTLLYGLSRETSKDKYLDAICMAICALMREEEAGKSRNEEPRPKEPDNDWAKQKKREFDKYGIKWRDVKKVKPEQEGSYRIKRKSDPQTTWCDYKNGEWFIGVGNFKFVIGDVVEWADIPIE